MLEFGLWLQEETINWGKPGSAAYMVVHSYAKQAVLGLMMKP